MQSDDGKCVLTQKKTLSFLVPQDCVAGPVLYNAYPSTLEEVVSTPIDLHGFADDRTIKHSFKPTPDEELKVIHMLEQCTSDIKYWMDANPLHMNSAKTEFLLVGLKQQVSKCVSTEINVNGEAVKCSTCIRYLGALADDKLNFKVHIANKCHIASGTHRNLKLYMTF